MGSPSRSDSCSNFGTLQGWGDRVQPGAARRQLALTSMRGFGGLVRLAGSML